MTDTAAAPVLQNDALSVAPDAISDAPAQTQPLPYRPSPDAQERIAARIAASRAPSTARVYAVQWGTFERYARDAGTSPLPASPEIVAQYLDDRASAGASRSTIQQAAAAIGAAHRDRQLPDPMQAEGVRRVRAGIARDREQRAPTQAAPIYAPQLIHIQSAARAAHTARVADAERHSQSARDRRSIERRQRADARSERRDAVDIALIATMRDAMLRVSEAAALRWCDVRRAPAGDGTITIARSKTDQLGRGAAAYVSYETMQALDAIRPAVADVDDAAPVFGLGARQISRRITAAAYRAKLTDDKGDRLRNVKGHSPRVGMAADLARTDASLDEIQNAGRWSSPAMPAYYTRNEQAEKNAIARHIYGKGG